MRTILILALILVSSFEGGVWAESLCSGGNEAAWKRLQSKPVKKPEDMVRDVEAFRSECGLPLVFRAGPKAEQGQKEDHPCGEVVSAFVKAMPSPSDPVTQSEEVFELGPAGEVIQRWWVPVDASIMGIAGKELIIIGELSEGPASAYLAIDPDGQFRAVPANRQFEKTPMPCPASQDLPKSAYLGCWKMTETTGRMERRIAYEGPCS